MVKFARRVNLNKKIYKNIVLCLFISLALGNLSFTLSNAVKTEPSASLEGVGSFSSPVDEEESIDYQFELLGPTTGWLLDGNHLFWTENNGNDWLDITPPISDSEILSEPFFLDESLGWVAAHQWTGTEFILNIFMTIDSGGSWVTLPNNKFLTDESNFMSGEIFMHWLDQNIGWVLIKKGTGNNFSEGLLFITKDGGNSWEVGNTPMGEPFMFIDEFIGFMAGGPDGSALFRSEDSGVTWQEINDQVHPSSVDSYLSFSLPAVLADEILTIAVYESSQASSGELFVYQTYDQGHTWNLTEQLEIKEETGSNPYLQIAPTSLSSYLVSLSGFSKVIKFHNGIIDYLEKDQDSFVLQDFSFSDQNYGWGLFGLNTCDTNSISSYEENIICSETTRFSFTEDGGINWNTLILPSGKNETSIISEFNSLVDSTNSTQRAGSNTEVFIGQGFDACGIPALSEMETWFSSSPYRTVNLYIGGISRACPNSALSKSYVKSLYNQGWKFFPTWVGHQAPCGTYNHPMSSDPATAYQQGVENANQAAATLADLGFTNPDGSGSVVYFDTENYSGDTACYTAVNSFLNGWTYRLHQLGIQSGVYGSSCASHLTNYFSLDNPPDVIWPAAWYHSGGDGYYNPSAMVWSVPCISDSVYDNHERIRQYEGGHYETWGSVSINIDCNVLDGIVAIPVTSDVTPPSNPTSISPGCDALNGEWQNSCKNTIFTWSGASDGDSGVAGYEYYWGTSATGTDTAYTTGTSYNPAAVSEGIYYFRLRTKDNEGNYATWKTMFVLKFDATPPSGTLIINEGNALTYRTLIRLQPTGSDNLSGARLIRFRDQGGSWGDWRGIIETDWVLPAFSNQTYRVEAEVQDAAGNTSLTIFDEIFLEIYPDQPSSNNYQLLKSTFGMSSISATSSMYTMNGTLAQSSTTGVSTSENYKLSSGFWNWLFEYVGQAEFFIYLPLYMK